MKKYLSMIAIAIASVMMITSCHKEEITYIDPDAPHGGSTPDPDKMEIEVEVSAELSGVMTKAVSMSIAYVNFKGQSGETVLNKDFNGQNLTFNTKSNTVGKGEKFGLCIKTTLADREVYASLTAPWVAMYRAQVKVNGEVKENITLGYSQNESMAGIKLNESIYDYPAMFRNKVKAQFNDRMIYLKIQENGEVAWGEN